MSTVTVKLDAARAKRLNRWARLSRKPKSQLIRAMIDRSGPILDGDDLIAWVDASAGRGLGLAQKTPRKK